VFTEQKLKDRYDIIKSKAISINSDKTSSERKLSSTISKLNQAVDKKDSLEEDYRIQQNSIDILRQIIDKMSQEHINRVTDLISYALRIVFHNRDYRFQIDLEDKRNTKYAEMYLIERRSGESFKVPVDSVGGGIRTIVGFTLQVFYIDYFNLNPVLFVDEAFSQISDDYIDGLKHFIDQLAEKRDFKIVLVTHDPRFISRADEVYEVDRGEVNYRDV